MATISRLKATEITNGNVINADDIDAELDQLVSEHNSKETRITTNEGDINTIETGALTFTGAKTFSDGILTDTISEETSAAGVTIDGLLIKDGGLPNYEYVVPNYLKGNLPSYTTSATITIPSGTIAADSTNANYITLAGNIVINLANSGAAGLDTGSEASDTWYYVYLIGDSTGVATPSALVSATNEAASGTITLPSGYDIKRQYPLAIRNDGSSNIIPFFCPELGVVTYQVQCTHNTGSIQNGTTQVLSAGTATTPTSIDCSAFIPPISQYGYFNYIGSGSQSISLAPAGSSVVRAGLRADSSATENNVIWMDTNTSQAVEYDRYIGSGSAYLDVMGYKVTEIAY